MTNVGDIPERMAGGGKLGGWGGLRGRVGGRRTCHIGTGVMDAQRPATVFFFLFLLSTLPVMVS